MTKEERIRAEKCLARFGDSIQIKDYGLALQIMHNQIVFAENQASKISSNGMLKEVVCEHPYTVYEDFSMMIKCGECGKYLE